MPPWKAPPRFDHARTVTTLYLARHGQTDYNRRGLVQGRGIDAPLDETGRQQAEALAEHFSEIPLTAAYSSTLRRARETAAIVTERHPGLEAVPLPGFDEMAWGVWEGRGGPAAREAYRALTARWGQGDYGHRIEGGESIAEVEARAREALGQVVRENPGGTVLVVAHGRLLRVLLASVLPEIGLARMDELQHHNCCLSHLEANGAGLEGVRALALNETAHLGALDPLRA